MVRRHVAAKVPTTAAPYRLALWREFNRLFSYSPKMIVAANGLVSCHGGPTNSGGIQFSHRTERVATPNCQGGNYVAYEHPLRHRALYRGREGITGAHASKRGYLEVDLGKPVRGIEDITIHEL